MDSCFVSLKPNTHLVKGNWGGLNRGENGLYGEKVSGGLNGNAWVNRLAKSFKAEKKAWKVTPNVVYAVATPNMAKQAAVSLLHWMDGHVELISDIFGS